MEIYQHVNTKENWYKYLLWVSLKREPTLEELVKLYKNIFIFGETFALFKCHKLFDFYKFEDILQEHCFYVVEIDENYNELSKTPTHLLQDYRNIAYKGWVSTEESKCSNCETHITKLDKVCPSCGRKFATYKDCGMER
jgi:lipopolysaccharide biosynthesis regulator YciM